MLKKYIIIVTIVIAIFFISCTETSNIDIPVGETQLVVNATLCPDSAISLILSKSKNVLNKTDIEYINNADIYVYESDVLVDTLKNKGNGVYIGNLKPSINIAYTIKVKTISDGVAEGSDSIPEKVKIQKIDTFVADNQTSQLLNCTISFSDPINTKNFYLFRILSADKANPKNIQVQNYTCYDQVIMGGNVPDTLAGGNIGFFDNTQFNGKIHSIMVSMLYPKNKIVYFQLWSISQAFYNYCSSIANNRYNNSSLFTEETQVISNIKGGLGIIAAYSISTDSIVVK